MAIELERLVARIEGDISGLRAELVKAGTLTDQATQKMQQSFTALQKPIVTAENALRGMKTVLGALAVRELAQATQRSVEYISTLADTAKQLDVNVERLQSLRFAFDQSGISSELADQSLRKLSVTIGNAVTQGGEARELFDRLGVSLTNVDGTVRSTSAVFDDVVDKLAAVGSAAERNALAVQLFGREAGPRLGELLAKGTGALAALEAQAGAVGAVLREELVEEVSNLGDRMDALASITKSQAAAAFSTALGPALESALFLVAELVTGINDTIQGIRVLAGMGADPLNESIEESNERIDYLRKAVAQYAEGFAAGNSNAVEATKNLTVELDKEVARNQALRDLYWEQVDAINRKNAATGGAPAAPGVASASADRQESSQERLARLVDEQDEELSAIGEHNKKKAEQAAKAMEEEEERQAGFLDRMADYVEENDKRIADAKKVSDEAALAARLETLRAEDDAQARSLAIRESAERRYHEQYLRGLGISADAYDQLNEFEIASAGQKYDIINSLAAGFAQTMSRTSKKAFEVSKALAIAEAVVNTYRAVVGAFASGASANIYVALAKAAVAAAFGFAQVRAIQSTQFGGAGPGAVGAGAAAASAGDVGGGGFSTGRGGPSVYISLPAQSFFSSDQVRELIQRIGEAQGDGSKIQVVS